MNYYNEMHKGEFDAFYPYIRKRGGFPLFLIFFALKIFRL
jgi:hypothetical protein